MNTPAISESEWEVMLLLWKQSPLIAAEIAELLPKEYKWKRNTVNTFLARLEAKNAICSERVGGIKRYSPILSERECQREERTRFLERVFRGNASPLIMQLVEEESLSDEECEELEELLNKRKVNK